MTLDYQTLKGLRERHPAWRLLCADQSVLICSFLHRAFILKNERVLGAEALASALADELYAVADRDGTNFGKTPLEYLNDWASPEKGWLRSFYKTGTDEQQFDLTPATEKALEWLGSLTERSFVGTESRLKTAFDLLRQMAEGSERDPGKRLAELRRKREEIDAEISRVVGGDIPILDDVALQERFQQVQQLVRGILTDFREVEQNLRQLERQTRAKITSWTGTKGELLEEVMGERDAIAKSDQGRSFQAFWDFLLASDRQEELAQLLDRVLGLPVISKLAPDARLARIHYDWLDAGRHTQRTVAQLSQQLRRYLDERAFLENRRIMELLRGIEAHALAVRDQAPEGTVTTLTIPGADVYLPFERPLYRIRAKTTLPEIVLNADDADEIDPTALFTQVVVDTAGLRDNLNRLLEERSLVTLKDAVEARPLEHGLAELIAYLQIASKEFETTLDEQSEDEIQWQAKGRDGRTVERRARLSRVIFVRYT